MGHGPGRVRGQPDAAPRSAAVRPALPGRGRGPRLETVVRPGKPHRRAGPRRYPARRRRPDLPGFAGGGDLLPDDAAPGVRRGRDVAVLLPDQPGPGAPFVAIPAFVSRAFRHNGIYVGAASRAADPAA